VSGESIRTIVFLCSGNYYRSRFAELVFNARARAVGLSWVATSAGLLPADLLAELEPISPTVLERVRLLGMALEGPPRSPRPVSRADLERADRVIALKETEHRPLMRRNFPDWENRIVYWAVHDVDVAPPSETLPFLERAVADLVEELRKA
jgi:protein-tyrosine phosphatase